MRRRAQRKGWLELPPRGAGDPVVKPAPYLPIYERQLAGLRWQDFALLELGLWKGDSLQMWRDAFPRATIVGIDLQPPDVDLGDRVHVIQGDQTDAELMERVRREYVPTGFDVVIDDASHFGVATARSLQALYSRHLRPGGLYFIEDWGTGYLPDWEDGGALAERLDAAQLDVAQAGAPADGTERASMPSHDLGLVGVIKRLVDHAGAGTVSFAQPDAVGAVLPIESMTVWDGIVMLRKRAA